jgi:Cu(I)/Ag(I) efflux system periplasmic protein CusF
MKTNAALFLALTTSALILGEPAFALEEQAHGEYQTSSAHENVGQSQNSFFNAEILKIDKTNGKVTIRHEEIKNLAMPPMMMAYQVKNPAMLNQFQEGDLVRIKAIMQNGKLVIATMILRAS